MQPMLKWIARLAIVLAISILVLFSIFVLVMFWQPKPEQGAHVAHVTWLPETAYDISYYERSGFGWLKIAEFSISEDDFKAYASKNGWELQNCTNVWPRAASFAPATEIDGFSVEYIEQAYCYDNIRPNGGGIRIIYDPLRQRAHYEEAHR